MSHITGTVDCYCGRRAVIRTSWTPDNPGRRFHSCIHYKRGGGGCGFFDWEDPPVCNRARTIIPGLLKRINAMESDIKAMESKIKAMESVIVKLKCRNGKLKKLVLVIPVLSVFVCWIWIVSQKTAYGTPQMMISS